MAKEDRGFGSMVKTAAGRAKQHEIASKGGRAAHEKGTAHEWTPDEARSAGRKGGQAGRGGRRRVNPVVAAGAADTGGIGSGGEGEDSALERQ